MSYILTVIILLGSQQVDHKVYDIESLKECQDTAKAMVQHYKAQGPVTVLLAKCQPTKVSQAATTEEQ